VTALLGIALTLVLAGAIAVVFTDDPQRQAVTLSVYGLLMTVLFMLLAAPDVALSQVVVGTAVVPLMVMLTIRKLRGHR
jgi:energy-converting hydrogenase B subunit D